ncbi:hypothetical protein AB0H77_14600 [Streptomyces sp. NPDC050844]|uniref:DUF7426 family protein n=1 Tax=Streptomyces sp. NPDC050844 TaxID=3155790 RepID=UPI0033EA06D5
MAGGFKVLDEFLGDSLDLPIKCKDGTVRTFHIPACSAEDGLRVQALMESGRPHGHRRHPDGRRSPRRRR